VTAPRGWYPDPGDARRQRWWNGSSWTEHTTQGSRYAPPPIAPRTSLECLVLVLAVLVCVLAVGVVGSSGEGSSCDHEFSSESAQQHCLKVEARGRVPISAVGVGGSVAGLVAAARALLRRRRSRVALTPVIVATIVLAAGLVFALAVGSSDANASYAPISAKSWSRYVVYASLPAVLVGVLFPSRPLGRARTD